MQRSLGRGLGFDAAPFGGDWRLATTPRFLLPVVLAVVAVTFGPRAVARARWSVLSVGAAAAWVVWVLALGLVDGAAWITGYLGSSFDYLNGVHRVGSTSGFLRHFTERIGNYPTHVRGHPPGMVVLLAFLHRIGLGGTGPELVLCLAGGALTVVAVMVTVRIVAGEPWARRCAPFLVLAPTTVVATNVDLFYAGLAAGAIALAALAATSGSSGPVDRRGGGEPMAVDRFGVVAADCRSSESRSSGSRGRATLLALGSGGLLGLAGLGSYGLVPVVLPVAALAFSRRRPGLLVPTGVAMVAVLAAPVLWGFWWPEGLSATSHQYWSGIASYRPGGYFAVANVVVAATMLGPVVLVSLALLWRRRAGRSLRPLVLGVLAIFAVALATQFSKGEVERIWQPFYPWLLAACGIVGAASGERSRGAAPWATSIGDPTVADAAQRAPAVTPNRRWLTLHVAATLALAFCLRSPW